MARQELACFLRDRRADLRPADVGLPAGPRRRTPGLRREEVARLASMSVEYYARIEQARGPHPSPRILDALAGALRLTPAERIHLFRLAGTSPAAPRTGPAAHSPAVGIDLVRRSSTGLLRRHPVRPTCRSGPATHAASRRQLRRDRTWNPLLWPKPCWATSGTSPIWPAGASSDPAGRRSSGGEECSHIAGRGCAAPPTCDPCDERLARLLADLRARQSRSSCRCGEHQPGPCSRPPLEDVRPSRDGPVRASTVTCSPSPMMTSR